MKKFTPAAMDRALEACEKYGNRALAAKAAGVCLSTLKHYLATDKEFRAKWDEAKEVFIAELEKEARRRAIEGWEEPRIGVGRVRKFDSSLLQLLLKANNPEKYRDQLKVEQTTHVVGSLGLDVLSPESRAKLREILESERGETTE